MKLRIRGNSLRLRLTKPEVASLSEQGWWEDGVTLGMDGQARFTYRIEAVDAGTFDVQFKSGPTSTVTAVVPSDQVRAWATTGSEVGIYFETAWGTKVAIEKDFRCLDERRDEDEGDNFDNPNVGASSHGDCGVV